MQTRRFLLVVGILLLLSMAAASLVPPPEGTQDGAPEGSTETEEVAEPTSPPEGAGSTRLRFAVEPASGRSTRGANEDAAPTRTVERGERVVVTVMAPRPGSVELKGLGRIQPVSPGLPAFFDLYTDSGGRYPVVYRTARGGSRVAGTVVVNGRGQPRPAESVGDGEASPAPSDRSGRAR